MPEQWAERHRKQAARCCDESQWDGLHMLLWILIFFKNSFYLSLSCFIFLKAVLVLSLLFYAHLWNKCAGLIKPPSETAFHLAWFNNIRRLSPILSLQNFNYYYDDVKYIMCSIYQISWQADTIWDNRNHTNPTQFPSWCSISLSRKKSRTFWLANFWVQHRYTISCAKPEIRRSALLSVASVLLNICVRFWGHCDLPHVWGVWTFSSISPIPQHSSTEGIKGMIQRVVFGGQGAWWSRSRSCIFVRSSLSPCTDMQLSHLAVIKMCYFKLVRQPYCAQL